MLSPEQLRLREGKITASFVPYLMAGKTDRIRSEWMNLVGHPQHQEPNWEEMWNLRYGEIIEPLALDWHQKKTGKALIRRGEVVDHPNLPHVCCTLDSYRAEDNLVLDCKAWSSWQKIDYICSFLCPQMIVQKACAQATSAALLIVHGGTEPVEYPLSWEAEYEATVWQRIAEFWQSVIDLTPPVAMPAAAAPVIAAIEYDMAQSNTWAAQAGAWLDHRLSSKTFGIAEKELKALVPADAKRCFGHGIQITKAKNGALTVKEMTA